MLACAGAGAPVLLDYLMAHGDSAFECFIFNSPFLDWGRVGGRVNRWILMYAPHLLHKLRVWHDETELLGGGGPSAWALQLYSQYPFDPRSRPLFTGASAARAAMQGHRLAMACSAIAAEHTL